ncbi:MAG: hypothetical protein FWC71_11855 [Defluviitaleaceae bacterium]|nr:hypothetical protein [Defluviitaleaceae bacterium]
MFDDRVNEANELEVTEAEIADDIVIIGCEDCEKLKTENHELEVGIAVVSVAMTFISVIVGLVTWMFAMKKYYKGDGK